MKEGLKKARSLSDIDLEEVSLVDLPANKRKFLFFKSGKPEEKNDNSGSMNKQTDLKLSIESDGTEDGTKILVNGKEVEKLDTFYFSYYKAYTQELDGKNPASISCSYSKIVEGENGFKRTESYHLAKGDNPMDEEMKELLAEILGDEFDAEEFAKAEALSDDAIKAVKDALKSLNEYKKDFPDELMKAVKVLVKYAGYGANYPAKTSDDNENKSDGNEDNSLEKSGRKLSKDTLEKLLQMFKTLQAILPEETSAKTKTEKSDEEAAEDNNAEVENGNAAGKDKVEKNADSDKSGDAFNELKKSIEKTSTENADTLKELSKTVSEISKRLEVVEKSKGVKKSIESQDDKNEENGENIAKGAGENGEVLWPSLVRNDDESDD